MTIEYLDRYFHYDKSMITEEPVFLEIGNYSGGNMKRLLKRFPNCRLIIYEAGLDNFKNLEKVYKSIGSPKNVSIHNMAIADTDGEVTFFEYKDKPSSNSVFERHKIKKTLTLENSHTISCTNLSGVMRDNEVDKIDVVFANAEGIEVMILDEICTNKRVRSSVAQLCLSMHERIVGEEAIKNALNNSLKFYSFEKGDGKWACHLFKRKQ